VTDLPQQDAWLASAEAIGLAALEQDLDPDAMARMMAESPPPAGDTAPGTLASSCSWWTDGAPRVPAGSFTTPQLPSGAIFARMIDSTDHHDIAAPRS
jgi:hypothetical protein